MKFGNDSPWKDPQAFRAVPFLGFRGSARGKCASTACRFGSRNSLFKFTRCCWNIPAAKTAQMRQLSCSSDLASLRSQQTYLGADGNRQRRSLVWETSLYGYGLLDSCPDRMILASKAKTLCERWGRDSQKRCSTRRESPPSQGKIAGLSDSILP